MSAFRAGDAGSKGESLKFPPGAPDFNQFSSTLVFIPTLTKERISFLLNSMLTDVNLFRSTQNRMPQQAKTPEASLV